LQLIDQSFCGFIVKIQENWRGMEVRPQGVPKYTVFSYGEKSVATIFTVFRDALNKKTA
jgi:hypothetical protein